MTTDSNRNEQPLAVIAIGGNSLIKDPEHMSVLDQYRAAGETAYHIASIINEGYRVVVTHGNGPLSRIYNNTVTTNYVCD